MKRERGVKYVISMGEDNCLNVYNSKWKLEFRIGKGQGADPGYMRLPCDCCFTEEGILVVDSLNHRICLFDFEGQFIRHVLTKKNGLDTPRGLVLRSPLLWVICKKKIMCFKFWKM